MSLINNTTPTVHRPERTRVAVAGMAAIREALEDAYGVRLRLKENRAGDAGDLMTHDRVDVGAFAVEHVHLPGCIELSPDPVGRVVVLRPDDGRVEGYCDGIKGEAGAGELTMVSQPDLPHVARAEDVSVTSLLLDPAVVASVAAGVPVSQAPPAVRFVDFRPVDAASARLLTSTLEYITTSVLAEDALATPLVIGRAGRLLAAVTVSTFPSSVAATESPHDRTDARPALLKRAIDYMERNAENDIALGDIADAIHVTPRAVQYMFRKHLDTTPLQYLRSIRLHRAHQDLIMGDRTRVTVTAIAARWGFLHSGRFAVLYRETYGQSPHATLQSS